MKLSGRFCTCRRCKCLFLPWTRSAAHKATVVIVPYNKGKLFPTSIPLFHAKLLSDTHPCANLSTNVIALLSYWFSEYNFQCDLLLLFLIIYEFSLSCLFIVLKFKYHQEEYIVVPKTGWNEVVLKRTAVDFTLQTCKPRLPIDPVSKDSVGEKLDIRYGFNSSRRASVWDVLGSFLLALHLVCLLTRCMWQAVRIRSWTGQTEMWLEWSLWWYKEVEVTIEGGLTLLVPLVVCSSSVCSQGFLCTDGSSCLPLIMAWLALNTCPSQPPRSVFPLFVTNTGCSSSTSKLIQLRGHFPLHLSVSVHPVGSPLPIPSRQPRLGKQFVPQTAPSAHYRSSPSACRSEAHPSSSFSSSSNPLYPPPPLAYCPPPSPSSRLPAWRRHQDIEVRLPGSQPKRDCIRQTYGHAFKILSLFNQTHQSNAHFLSGADGWAEALVEDRCWRKISMFFSECVKVITRAHRGNANWRKMCRIPFKGCAQTHQGMRTSDYTKWRKMKQSTQGPPVPGH